MQATTDMGFAAYHRQLEASRDFARTLLEGTQKVELMVMDSTRKNLDRILDFAEACAAARDPEGVGTLQYTFFGHSPDELIAAQKKMADIMLQTGAALGSALGQMLPAGNLFGDAQRSPGTAEPQVVDAQSRPVEPWNTWALAWRQFADAAGGWPGMPAPPAAGAQPSAAAVKKPAARKSAARARRR